MKQPNIRRNISESGENLYINRWWSGEVTQRSPLYAPVSAFGFQIISRHDVLYGGSNMELSPKMTLVRRYGFSKYSTAQFGASDYPLAYFSFKNTSGTIKLLVDTPTMVAQFTSIAITSLYTKGTTQQTSFAKVGNTVYMCDGTNLKKWNQTTLSAWGSAAPTVTPGLTYSAGSLSPTSGYQYVYVYKNSSTGYKTTASPASASTGAQTSKNITVSYTASTDAQIDKIDIYRTKDGGSTYFYLTEVANATSSYTDSTADSGLNTALVAAVAHQNDPPPAGASLVVWHNDRLFVAVNNLLYASTGPDTTDSVAEECFNPAYVWKLPGKIYALISTDGGLAIFTDAEAFLLLGQDTVSYWLKPWLKNFGVASMNCVVRDGSTLYVYTTKSQLWQIDPSGGLTEVGFPVGDQLLSNYSPTASYLTVHRNGSDKGVFISDGSSRLKRYNPDFNSWDPTSTPANGCMAIDSIETSAASFQLFVGRPTASGYLLKRDTTLYTDDGTAYTCSAIVGSLLVAPPGSLANISQVMVQSMPVGTFPPTVGVLLNEISGSFSALSSPVNDPPMYSGTAYASATVSQQRFYFKSASAAPLPELIQHMQIQLSFPAENFRAEVLGLGIE